MVQVEIGRMELDGFHLEVTVRVEGKEAGIAGNADYFSEDIPLVDPETGARLTFQSDPERWARNLPQAYRAGDIVVRVKEI